MLLTGTDRGMLDSPMKTGNCGLADGSPTIKSNGFLAENYKEDARIRYRRLLENGGISENTNEAVADGNG